MSNGKVIYKKCRCGKKITFCKTKKGKTIPVNLESLSEADRLGLLDGIEILYRYGDHITHFADCPFAIAFRNKRKEPK